MRYLALVLSVLLCAACAPLDDDAFDGTQSELITQTTRTIYALGTTNLIRNVGDVAKVRIWFDTPTKTGVMADQFYAHAYCSVPEVGRLVLYPQSAVSAGAGCSYNLRIKVRQGFGYYGPNNVFIEDPAVPAVWVTHTGGSYPLKPSAGVWGWDKDGTWYTRYGVELEMTYAATGGSCTNGKPLRTDGAAFALKPQVSLWISDAYVVVVTQAY